MDTKGNVPQALISPHLLIHIQDLGEGKRAEEHGGQRWCLLDLPHIIF